MKIDLPIKIQNYPSQGHKVPQFDVLFPLNEYYFEPSQTCHCHGPPTSKWWPYLSTICKWFQIYPKLCTSLSLKELFFFFNIVFLKILIQKKKIFYSNVIIIYNYKKGNVSKENDWLKSEYSHVQLLFFKYGHAM